MRPLVCINREACDRIARFISTKEIPLDREDSSLQGWSRERIGNFYLALVAICHQTSPRGRPPLEGWINGIKRVGWDYLFARLEEAARCDPALLTPGRWSEFTAGAMRDVFRDAELGDRLTNPDLRAELWRDLGSGMTSRGWECADQIYNFCESRAATGCPNLLDTLAEFRAYNDPVRKKAVFFLAIMKNSGLWKYPDGDALGPPVDYHEVRGHLRLQTVCIINSELLEKVRTGTIVTAEEDVAIRRGVYDAIMHISQRSGLRNPSQLHYLFWNLFRSICTRDAPQCFVLAPDNALPQRYRHFVEDGGCPFAAFCPSAGSSHPTLEHVFETDYY